MLTLSTVNALDKNRVWDFFTWSLDCAGQTGTQVLDCNWEITSTATIPRQGNSLTQKEWQANKDDCNKLSKDWGFYINAVPDKTRFTSSEEAAVGALFHTMLNHETTSREYGGNIYSDWSLWKSPNFHFGTHYFFSPPQKGADVFVTIKDTVSFWQTSEGQYHTHPVVLTGKWKGYIPSYDEFSPDDKLSGWRNGVEFMGNETGSFLKWQSTGDPRGVTMNRDGGVAGGYFPGQQSSLAGAPSKEEFTKIQACRNADFL